MIKFKQMIKEGDKGTDVLAVRRALRVMGYKIPKTGRKAGPKWVNAIKEVQKTHKLVVDGVYGPKTHLIISPHFDAFGRLLYRGARIRHPKLSMRMQAVKYALESLGYHGEMHYTEEEPYRSDLFNRRPGDFRGASADCSQFVSAIMHWVGVKSVNDTDATGTLLEKGKDVDGPALGRLVVFGPGGGVHTGMFTEQRRGVWYLVEFGMSLAPDIISLPAAEAFFEREGRPGVRYLDFFE